MRSDGDRAVEPPGRAPEADGPGVPPAARPARAAPADGDDAPPDGRWERLHPLTLGFATIGVARRFLFPALLAALGTRAGGDPEALVGRFLLILAVPAIGAAAVRWLTFRYAVRRDELAVRSGVLSRRERIIPLERVQNIEVRRSLLERLFGAAELRVETAGAGRETEAVLSVLSERRAEALRTALLAGRARRRRIAAEAGEVPGGAARPGEEPEARPVVRLGTRDLALAGATANEAGVIAVFLGGALQFADELSSDLLERVVERAADAATTVPGAGWTLAAVLGVAALLAVGWVVSVVGSVVRYHGFALDRAGDELRKEYGLLSRRESSVPLRRVQAVRLEESVLRRPLGLAALQVETAGGVPGGDRSRGAEAFVPLARSGDVPRLVREIFPDLDLAAARFRPVHPASRRRARVRLLVPVALAAAAGGVLGDPRWLVAAAVLAPLAWLFADAQYRNRGWALAPGYVLAREGVLNRVTWIVPDARMQTLHHTADPFQRRLRLATLAVDTAAGGRKAAVRDLAAGRADRLLGVLGARLAAAARAEDAARRRRTARVAGVGRPAGDGTGASA